MVQFLLNIIVNMFRFVILAVAFLCSAYAADMSVTPFGRMVNGVTVAISEVPWQVSIQTTSGSHFCGGSIIGPYHVVTAAHCMQKYSANKLQIRLGSDSHSSGGSIVGVKSFINHPKYNSASSVYDIAIIKLKRSVSETSTIRYIPLTEVAPVDGTVAVVSGWGVECYFWCSSLSTSLKKIEVKTINAVDCQAKYKYKSGKILDTMICGYETQKDSCQGDSGGPMVANGRLVGVVSWGEGCAKTGYPGVYADISELGSWLTTTAANM